MDQLEVMTLITVVSIVLSVCLLCFYIDYICYGYSVTTFPCITYAVCLGLCVSIPRLCVELYCAFWITDEVNATQRQHSQHIVLAYIGFYVAILVILVCMSMVVIVGLFFGTMWGLGPVFCHCEVLPLIVGRSVSVNVMWCCVMVVAVSSFYNVWYFFHSYLKCFNSIKQCNYGTN
jgi:hypothetical protein